MTQEVVIVGAGGHGREVLEIVRELTLWTPLGFVDDNVDLQNTTVSGLPVLGPVLSLRPLVRQVHVICAIGNPRIAKQICEDIRSWGLEFFSAVSSTAKVSSRAHLGKGVAVFPGAIVSVDAKIHDHAIINVGATVSHDSVVGRYANVNPGAHLAGNVAIGEGAYIGMGSNLIQNIRVGDWSTIGAGAVVNRDIPPGVTAIGVPAKFRSAVLSEE